jgi:predicted transcriptional regulator
MTMLSFRVSQEVALELQRWAQRLGVDRSEILREAVRRDMVRRAAENDITAWEQQPVTDDEQALGAIADWGPAEDWSDWARSGSPDGPR